VSSWENDIGYDSGHNMFAFGEAGYWSMLSDGRGAKHANDTSQGDLRAVTKAIHFMQHDPPEPFVIFLATRGAHPPYGAPPEYTHKWTLDQVKRHVTLRPPNDPRKPQYHQPDVGIQHYRNLTGLDEDTFYNIQRTYLEMVSFTDWTFGQLLTGLEAADGGALAKNTAVFHSSDHGDFSGYYHLVEKWPGGADDVLTHVPMAARIPGGVPHNVAKGPVQSMDMMETMLELAGITSDWVRFGRSLAPVMREGGAGTRSGNNNNNNNDNDNYNITAPSCFRAGATTCRTIRAGCTGPAPRKRCRGTARAAPSGSWCATPRTSWCSGRRASLSCTT
jgi:arylsulfatase A-like enzyme